MKKILVLVSILSCVSGIAQVKGNKEITESFIATEAITDIEVGLYGEILIDGALENGITITTDSNLIDLIDYEVVDGKLKLDQKKWIQPSRRMKIVIGAPELRRVQLSTNDQLEVINLKNDKISAMALNGKIALSGSTEILNIGAENGTVDARQLRTSQVFVNIWGWGKAQFDTADRLEAKLSNEAQIEYNTRPKEIKGNIDKALANSDKEKKTNVRYINFKIRNNSENRHDFYVVGPKPDGKKFSYGFPMMPGATRKENWTTGTKVYKVSGLGIKKLLITISEDAEDQVVDLF